MTTSDPMKPVRDAIVDIRSRIRKLDSDLRAVGRDQSLRVDKRRDKVLQIRQEAEAEVRQLRNSIPAAFRQAARENAPRIGGSGNAADRTLYSTRAQGMLAAGDLHGLRRDIRNAIRTGDLAQAQEYLAVAGRKLTGEFGAGEVFKLQKAATEKHDRRRAAVHEAMNDRANDTINLQLLHRYVEKALAAAGSGDPYDAPEDADLGRSVVMWGERMDDLAGEAATKALDSYAAADRAVVESD